MTSIPPPSAPPPVPTPSGAAAPSAPTAPAGGSGAILTQVPPAVRAAVPGTVITGTVVGRDTQGQTLLQTNEGVVAFKTAAALTVGSQISLQIQTVGSQFQAVILSALAAGAKTGSATPGGQPAGAARAAAAPATTIAPSVSGGGGVITATVIGPSGGAAPGGPPSGMAPATAAPNAGPSGTAAPATPPAPAATGTAASALPAAQTRVTAAPPSPGGTPASSPTSPSPAPTAAASPSPAASPTASAPSSAPTALLAQQATSSPTGVSTAAARYAATPGSPPATPGTASPAGPATPAAASPAATATAGAPAPAGTALLRPAPAGATVQVRFVPLVPGTAVPAPTPGAAPVSATIVAHAANGRTLVDTPVGRLTVTLPSDAGHQPIGSRVPLEILSVTREAAGPSPQALASNAAKALPTLGQEWPTLKAAMTALTGADPSFARQLLEMAMPRLGTPRFLSQLLGHLRMGGGPPDARALLGDTAVALLEKAGRGDILARLDAELREMNRLNNSASDWRLIFLPIADLNELRQLRVYTRKKKSKSGKEREHSGRFIVEAEFEAYGPLQIDGLVQKPRIDVIVRSHVEFPPSMQAGIAEVFGRTCDVSGLVGKIFFNASPTFPVSPLDEITQAGQDFRSEA